MSDAPRAQTLENGYELRIGRYGLSLAEAFMAAAGIQAGQRVLDVGCGTGALSERLVTRLGPGAVTGIDPGAGDVAKCAARCPGMEVVVGEAEALPFADATFDAALAQLVLGHLRDPELGVREMARVVRAGGTVAACVWDFAEGMTVLRTFWQAAAEVDRAGAARFDQALTHSYGDLASLEGLWAAAGLRDVRTDKLAATAGYEDFDDLWQPMTMPDGAPGRFLATLDSPGRGRVREALRARLRPPDAPFSLQARALFVAGAA